MNPPIHNFAALTTDLYEVTMACGYWKAGVSECEAAFYLAFRDNPFGGQFTVACGLEQVVDLVRGFRFQEHELGYLAAQRGNDGRPLFDAGFLDYLRALRLSCDIDAVPEGTFPPEPLVRVCGPIIHCQLLETALRQIQRARRAPPSTEGPRHYRRVPGHRSRAGRCRSCAQGNKSEWRNNFAKRRSP